MVGLLLVVFKAAFAEEPALETCWELGQNQEDIDASGHEGVYKNKQKYLVGLVTS